MAGYGGQLVALDAENSPLSAYDLSQQTQNTQASQLANQLRQGAVTAQDTQNQSSQLALAGQKQDANIKTIAYNQDQIANVLKTISTAKDPVSSWDQQLQKLADSGNDEAGQLVGRYSPFLVERLKSVYGNAPQPGTVSPEQKATWDQQYQGQPAQALATALQHTDQIEQALETVHDQSSLNAAIQGLVNNGMQEAAQFKGMPYNPDALASIYRTLDPHRQYLQDRLTSQAGGEPAPLIPTQVEKVGNSVVGIRQGPDGTATAKPLYTAPSWTEARGGLDASGNPIFFDKNNPNGAPAAAGALAGVVAKIQASENATGNPEAKNPNSSATGNGQFIAGTWLPLYKASYPDEVKGMTDSQILAQRSNPQKAAQMTLAYAQQNAQQIAQDGYPVTGGTIAAAHKLGATDAEKVFVAPDTDLLSNILSPAVIKANPQLAGITKGVYMAGLGRQFGTDPINPATPAADTSTLVGDDLLKTLSPAMAAQVKAIADGRMQVPSNFFLKTPLGQRLAALTAQYDPSFDAANYATRIQTRKNFTTGKQGDAVNALNTVAGHLANLDNSATALDNIDFTPYNTVANLVSNMTGDPRVKKFNADKTAVTNELTRVFRGSGGSEKDIDSWDKNLDAAGSPAQLHGVIKEIAGNLIDSRLSALSEQYNQGMQRSEDPFTLLHPHAAALLQQLAGASSPGAASVAVPVATPASTKAPHQMTDAELKQSLGL